MVTPVAIGVDNGGTWIRLQGINSKGLVIWTLRKPSPTVDQLPAFLRTHLKRFRGTLQVLAVGSRGVWAPAKKRALKRALQDLAPHIRVMSDVEAAWLAAFSPHPPSGHPLPSWERASRALPSPDSGEGGRRPDEGIIVIAGTGSIAYGRTAKGQEARAGGLGPDKGDEGSGYWIGKQWLGHIHKPLGKVRQTAAWTPAVIQKARHGNPDARTIVEQAQRHLANLVADVARQLPFRGEIPLSVSGSVLANTWFRRGFLKYVRETDLAVTWTPIRMDPARAIINHVPC